MAYTTYTPTATEFSDVDLPDDAQLETSGIGTVTTPMETQADGLLYVTQLQAGTIPFASVEYDQSGGIIVDTITGVTATTVQYDPGTGDEDIEYDVAGCISDNEIHVFATFGISAPNAATVRIRVEYGATSEVVCSMYAPAGVFVCMCLQGIHTMLASGTATFTLEVVNLVSASTPVYGPVTFSAQRHRSDAP